MLIWSVIPNQMIWQNSAQTEKERAEQGRIVQVRGTQVLVDPMANGKGRVRQVLSTNPADFLRVDLTPGSIVNLSE